jgi:hypothetical protein
MGRNKASEQAPARTSVQVDLADVERLYSTARAVELRLEEVLHGAKLPEDVQSRLAGAMVGAAQIAQFASGLWFEHPIPCPAFRNEDQYPKAKLPPKKR